MKIAPRAALVLSAVLPLLSCSAGSHRPMEVPIASAKLGGMGGQAAVSCSALALGADGAFQGFVPDASDAWHQDVSQARVAENSESYFKRSLDIGRVPLHPDFGSQGGIPYNVVDSSKTAMVPVPITLYGDDSDISVAPIPAIAPQEGDTPPCTDSDDDQHLIVVDRNTCVAYEYFQAKSCHGAWSAGSSAMFDLQTPSHRPFGMTSADAAGMSVLEGLVRYDEILAGHIDHAIRFTTRLTKKGEGGSYVTGMATHGAGQNTRTNNIMGMRIRLKPDVDVSRFSRTNQIILEAMKQYGMILADNGQTMFFQGTRDPRWNDVDLKELTKIRSTDFEVLEMGPVRNTNQGPKGNAPQILSFQASPGTTAAGAPVTLNAVVTGASYEFVDQAGFLRNGSVVVRPLHTTKYKLTARNEFGTATQEVEVQVR